MDINRTIQVTNRGFSPILSIAQGTDMVRFNFRLTDFDIPSESAAVAYNIQPTGNIVPKTCSISGNTVSVDPPAYYFLRGKNYMQIQITNSGKRLVSFLIEVWCSPNIATPEVVEMGESTVTQQLLSEVGLLSARINNLAKLTEGSTTGDAELRDIRIGYDGTEYENAGEAVRSQVGSLSEDIEIISAISNVNFEQGGIDTSNGVIVDSENRIRSKLLLLTKGTIIKFNKAARYYILEYYRQQYNGIFVDRWSIDSEEYVVTDGGYYKLLVRSTDNSDIGPADYVCTIIPPYSSLPSLMSGTMGFFVNLKTSSNVKDFLKIGENSVTLKNGFSVFGKYRGTIQEDISAPIVNGSYLILESIENNYVLSCVPDDYFYRSEHLVAIFGFFASNGKFIPLDYNYKIEEKFDELKVKYFVVGEKDNLAEKITEALKYKNSVVYIEPYEHDCYQEWEEYFGSGYFETLSSGHGIDLYNNIIIKGASGSKLKLHYTGNNDYVQSDFSLFNNPQGGSGYVLENLDVETSKIRYCVHDERSDDGIPYTVKYSRCKFLQDNSQSTWDHSRACIGGGLGLHGDVTVEDCIFDTVTSEENKDSLAYHNSYAAGAKNSLVIKGCYCKGDSTLQIASYGESTLKSDILISNNSFGSPIEELHWGSQDNFDIMYINNEIRNS